MHEFRHINGHLYCERVPVEKIARSVGTPFYLYSRQTLENHFRAFDGAFSEIPHIVSFAVKANANLALLRLFAREGAGADVVSGGELYRALSAGIDPRKIVFAGVGKTEEEIRYALTSDILMLNVESSQEIALINQVARQLRKKARVALRVNPDIDPRTHPYIATGLKKHKFGISISQALEAYHTARTLKNIQLIGVHSHIGSQLTDTKPLEEALEKIIGLVKRLRKIKIGIRYINIGGGLGITYDREEPPHPRDLAKALIPLARGVGCTLILEPGRVIVGNAGILVTRVLYTKRAEDKHFVIVDAGMTDLIRPSLYGAYHEILPVVRESRKKMVVDVVGPVCESADFLAKDREIPECRPGDLLAVMSAGAYGFAMSSNYNARPRPPEVLVTGQNVSVIRRRETYRDLTRGERIPRFLR